MAGRTLVINCLALAKAFAATAAVAADTVPCDDPQGRQQVMNACIARKVEAADAALNRTYGALEAKLNPNGRRNLVAAERAWINFRDRECDLRTGFDAEHPENNGTIAPFLTGLCRLDLTTRRTTDLATEMKCPGGDLACPP